MIISLLIKLDIEDWKSTVFPPFTQNRANVLSVPVIVKAALFWVKKSATTDLFLREVISLLNG
jgi:hypothetical protein